MTTQHDHEYLRLVRDVLENGVTRGDRTGTGTVGVFSREMRFDLSDGTIPLLTTKKMHTKSVIHEILWYLQGSGSGKYLKDNDIRIWNEWMSEDDHLDKVYGYQWRQWPVPEQHNQIDCVVLRSNETNEQFTIPTNNPLKPIYTGKKQFDKIIGETLTSHEYGQYTIISIEPATSEKNSKYLIQFKEDNTTAVVQLHQIKKQTVRNVWAKTVAKEGCLGDIKEKPHYYTKAYNMWHNMIRKCHDATLLPEYTTHGGKGVFVDTNWRCFSNFLHDIKYLPGFDNWKNDPSNYVLDKEYFGSGCYSKNTCVFISNKYNKQLSNHDGSKLIATHKDDPSTTIEALSCKDMGKIIKVSSQQICNHLNHPDRNKAVKGFVVKKTQPPTNHAYRIKLFVDQIAQVIDTIKNNPNDRRMIVNAWNVGQLQEMALPPCHFTFQFWVNPENKSLSCKVSQRSCDVGLGVPFNIVQYSILTRMIAHVTGLHPGELIWSGGDIHIYHNHVKALEEQLTRDPLPSPTLELSESVENIDDFKYSDFKISNYQHHPLISMKVSV